MSTTLPTPIDLYFASENAHDPSAIDQCFAAGAVVRDEGKTITGVPAIKAWRVETGKSIITPSSPSPCRTRTVRWCRHGQGLRELSWQPNQSGAYLRDRRWPHRFTGDPPLSADLQLAAFATS